MDLGVCICVRRGILLTTVSTGRYIDFFSHVCTFCVCTSGCGGVAKREGKRKRERESTFVENVVVPGGPRAWNYRAVCQCHGVVWRSHQDCSQGHGSRCDTRGREGQMICCEVFPSKGEG